MYNKLQASNKYGGKRIWQEKTKEEADKTRTNILYTALNLFFEKGYARTSLDDIASACGITRGQSTGTLRIRQTFF
jgi:hypothetical protein